MTNPLHVPVLLDRVVSLLAPALESHQSVFVDATLGLGGHAEAVLVGCPAACLVGIDRDRDALDRTAVRLAPFASRVTVIHAVYDQLRSTLGELGLARVQGVLFDLGVSSMQLDQVQRGFSYSSDAPLDMRMDTSSGQTAAEVVNTYSAEDLSRVLLRYGEERFARRIASSIVRERAARPLVTTAELVRVVRAAIPAPARRTGGNPAKRTFQALRIEVNDELAALSRALPQAIDALAVGGRIVVLSYQSLEDRLVKRALAARVESSAPLGLPVVPPGHDPQLRLLTRGGESASDDEIRVNPRAASVRMRAAERIREVA